MRRLLSYAGLLKHALFIQGEKWRDLIPYLTTLNCVLFNPEWRSGGQGSNPLGSTILPEPRVSAFTRSCRTDLGFRRLTKGATGALL
jgi:hypothetical protein